MKTFLLAAALLCGLTAVASAEIRTRLFDEHGKPVGVAVESGNTTTFYDEEGKETGSEKRYRLDDKLVRVTSAPEGGVEIRYVPGWQLDPKCRSEDCSGGQGFLLFHGREIESTILGEGRLDRRGACGEWFRAFVHEDGRKGNLVLRSEKGSKCKVTLRPAR